MVRVKHRYLLVHILRPDSKDSPSGILTLPSVVQFGPPVPDTVDAGTLLRAVREQLTLAFGDYGAAIAGATLKINYFSNATSTFILRAPRDHFRLVWAALAYTNSIALGHEKPSDGVLTSKRSLSCVMRVVRVSGTIRKAEEEAVRRARLAVATAQGHEPLDAILRPRQSLVLESDSDDEKTRDE